jgi:nucleoside-diphosphate-sugar epimerase
MGKEDLSRIKGQVPVSVIVHGGNYISYLLAKTLLEQGSYVVIIDKYTNTSKQYFSQLKKSGKVSFIDFKGIKGFYEKIARIDYLYYMLGQKIEESPTIDSKDFLSETDYLNQSLSCANKYKAKIALITSLRLNRELSNIINNDASTKTKPYSPLELQRYGENYCAEYVDKTKANLRIIRLGTLIGRGVSQINDSVLDKLFSDATQKHQIEIIGEGLEVHNLIHESDAIYGILKLTFSDDTKGEVISLCNKNDYSTLSIAYKLLELDVEAKAIKFIEREDANTILQDLYVPAPNATSYGWKQNITLEQATIEQINAYYEKSDKKWEIDKTDRTKDEVIETTVSKTKLGEILSSITSPFKKLVTPKKLFEKINYSKIFTSCIIFVLLLLMTYYLISPFIGISLGSYLIYSQGKQLSNSISELDFDKIQKETDSISKNITQVENNFNKLFWLFKITNSQEEFSNLYQIVQGTKLISESGENLVIGLRPLGEYVRDYEPSINKDGAEKETVKEYKEYLTAIDDNRYLLQEGVYKMSLAQNLITKVDTRKYPNFIKDFVYQYKELVNQIDSTVKPLEKASEFLPDLLGVDERKRYLILLQDNGEIRSSGGWISNYAVIAIENGQIYEIFIDDIYNAQALLALKGFKYRDPNSMTRALQGVTYSFPLVNWDPNLENVLLSSEQFIYDLGKGDQLDGIIALDTVFLQRLLDAWEGVEVAAESDLITSENLYSNIAEDSTSQSPTEIRRSSFLTDLFNSVLTKIFSTKLTDNAKVYEVISKSINEKNIIFNFKNSSANTYLSSNGWVSNLEPKYQSAPIDIDWNWGNNKANLYIKKNHILSINIKDENTIDYSYQITVQNDSKNREKLEGDYINYIRVYIPIKAELTNIRGIVDNKYNIYNENGYQVVAGWFNTPIQDTATIDIRYRVKNADSSFFPIEKTDTHYNMLLDIYKQPGSRMESYSLSIAYPQEWTLENSRGLTRIENTANRRFELSSDQHFSISWVR